jgi:hypothetical protein
MRCIQEQRLTGPTTDAGLEHVMPRDDNGNIAGCWVNVAAQPLPLLWGEKMICLKLQI